MGDFKRLRSEWQEARKALELAQAKEREAYAAFEAVVPFRVGTRVRYKFDSLEEFGLPNEGHVCDYSVNGPKWRQVQFGNSANEPLSLPVQFLEALP